MVKSRSVWRCTLFVLNGSHLSSVAEEGGARLSQRRRIFHIAYINSNFVFFIAFIAFYSLRVHRSKQDVYCGGGAAAAVVIVISG